MDWGITVGFIAFVTVLAFRTRKYTRSVADFLSANRCAGRYMLATAENMAMVGAISVLAQFQLYYYGGFGSVWWSLMFLPTGLILCLLGWVVYRFRETRALTLAQFFEMRYSRNFRIYAGILMFVCGVINFGIFPAIGARFFIYFCGFGDYFNIGGIAIASFPLTMGVLLGFSLIFTLLGGQIAVMVTDFVQGVFSNIVFTIIAIYLLMVFAWPYINEAYQYAPQGQSLVNPFKGGDIESFNIWFFLIVLFMSFYNCMAWQGTQGFNSAAKNPHESKMGKILGNWRANTQTVLWVLLPVCAYTIMHNANYADKAAMVNDALSGIDNDYIKRQMIVPIAMSTFLPVGLFGGMVAVMFAGFVSVHESYLHSWASIFIQDVILPFRNQKPFTPKQHLLLLRLAITGVAIFIFFWSLFFRQTEYILMYMYLTGALYLGGAGAVIIGGLYWKRGTTAAAWSALMTGSVLAVTGLVIRQIKPDFFLDGTWISFIAAFISLITYVLVSLLGPRQEFNLDKLLHRGQYAISDGALENHVVPKQSSVFYRIFYKLGLSDEFTKSDRFIYFASILWALLWSIVFVAGTIYNVLTDVKDRTWIMFWYGWLIFGVICCAAVTIWLTIGGIIDMKRMYTLLNGIKLNDSDDGTVSHSNTIEGDGHGHSLKPLQEVEMSNKE